MPSSLLRPEQEGRSNATHSRAFPLAANPVDWPVLEADDDMLNSALTSPAATLWSLRQLGYRSRPVWKRFSRIGTVTAQQRSTPWTWTSHSGQTMQANAGDWQVRADRDAWSVRNGIFQASYERVDGDQWRRRGTVSARPAQPARRSRPSRDPQRPATGTGWSGVVTVKNGRYPPRSSPSGMRQGWMAGF